jgi:hypothetical protein
MKSVMKHRFSEIPSVNIQRSTFDRSHGFKTTFDAGYLVPCFIDETLPGDTFRLNMTGFARIATPTYPIMDNMRLDTFFFWVPWRLVWTNYKKFFGEQIDPGDSIDYTIPIMDDDGNCQNFANQSLWDYFGLPTKVTDYYEFNALIPRCYNVIYNEWFRDQNLQDSVPHNTDDGPDDQADYELLRRGKRHDYFTSALPWLQKGDAVELSLGTEAPIFGSNMDFDGGRDVDNTVNIRDAAGGSANLRAVQYDNTAGGYVYGASSSYGTGEIKTDLSQATASTVNELRQAIQVQRLLEKDARSGTRYAEIVQSHFGVRSDDLRLARPMYLGGGSTPVNITPIARTDSSPGELGAMGIASFTGHGFNQSFTEHGFVMGIMCVRADLTYQEGIEKLWNRQTRYDVYWPTLAHLGEQAILNREIYIDATDIGDGTSEEVFGYQERYAEYRYKPSKITGKFRSNDAASLDAWHLGIEFGDTPTLDDTFIVENPPLDRCIATPSEPHFIFDSYIDLKCTRPMPIYSIPGYIDHF